MIFRIGKIVHKSVAISVPEGEDLLGGQGLKLRTGKVDYLQATKSLLCAIDQVLAPVDGDLIQLWDVQTTVYGEED